MIGKLSFLAMLGLACASCASTSIQPVSRVVRGETAMRVDRSTHTGNLLVSNFYYDRENVTASSPLMRNFDARARQAGCLNGAVPRRTAVRTEQSSYRASTVIAYYVCR
jgi:hypothetical protein